MELAWHARVHFDEHLPVMAMSYFWCLEHKTVEEGFGCGSTSRIGPYETQAEAASALGRTKQREAEQEARDADDASWGDKR